MDRTMRFERLRRLLLSLQWLGPIAIALSLFGATALTWRKWPDVVTDFGAQLYLPWQLSTGRVLYLDIPYLTGGPLSQYYHALLFKLFGVSLLTVVMANLLLTTVLLILLYRRFKHSSDSWTATMICLGIVLVFAFNQYSGIGNFNFITPYCHEVWHGLVLSIITIVFLASWAEKARIGYAVAAGFCAGLVFLTKSEVFAALAVAVTAAFVLFGVMRNQMKVLWQSLAGFFGTAFLPVFGFVLYFHRFTDWPGSVRAACFAWAPLLTSSASKNPFYKWCMGLDAPAYNFRLMSFHYLIVVAVVVLCAFLFRRKMDSSAKRLATAGFVALLLALVSDVDWVDCGRSLPLVGLTLCGILCAQVKGSIKVTDAPGNPERNAILIFPLLWSAFGLALLAKLGLFSRIWHYGFALAMPAFVGAIFLLLWLLPRRLERYGVRPRLFRAAISLVLLVGFLRLFVQSEQVYNTKTVAVGHGGDQMMAFKESINPAATAVNSALAWLATNAPPEATLAVLPEGVMVNYLSRRTNPAGYFVWNPVELNVFGQTNMVRSFQNHTPDFIMLIHRDTAEFGVKFFGQEERFGLDLMRWIEQNYTPVCLIGNEPLRNALFGIKILRRNAR